MECIKVVNVGCEERILVTHGGAGGWDERRAGEALKAVHEAAARGYAMITDPLLAVVAAVKHMEDSGVLNAGLGAVPALDGSVELDAGVASSEGLVGAVAGVALRNPVLAALVVALETPHVLMAGRGAEQLAEEFGVAKHPGAQPERVAMLLKAKERMVARLRDTMLRVVADTVGAVAFNAGRLAAATSTGGVMAKLRGRVGDTPIYGAGFYADENIACSATGIGETIILSMPCLRLALEAGREGGLTPNSIARILEEHTRRFGCSNLGLILVDRRGCAYVATNARMPVGVASAGRVEAQLVKAL